MGASETPPHILTPPSLPEPSPPAILNEDVESEEPTAALSSRLKTSFRKQYTASKNIMNCQIKKQLIIRSKRQRRYQSLMETPSDPSIPLPAVVALTTICESSGIHVTPPAFRLLEVDRKQFILMKHAPILKDYQLLGEIGKGSFGSVLRARQRSTGQTRAVKRINKLNLSFEARLSLINQFQILRRLDHPNIIKLYEMYDADDSIYVVTELCQGGNLLDHVTSTKLMSQEDIRGVMGQLLGAVRYMHDHCVLHRDIKLENIVLVKRRDPGSSQRLQIKLIDFGISLDLTQSRPEDNTPMGTLLYMSPESLDSRLELSSDVYSCGIVLFIMATRRIPFQYRSEEDLMQKISRGEILRKYMTALPVDLRVFLPRLLEKDFKKRLTAVAAMDSLWLTRAQRTLLSNSQRSQLAQQMLAYDAKNNLISLIEGFLVSRNINQEERQRLARLFQAIDVDRSGVVELEEFKQFYHRNSEHYDSNQIEELAAILDKNRSGNIDFNEFITVMYSRRELFQLRHLEVAFDFLDADGSGEISKVELEEILKGVQHEEIRYLFKEVDKNQDQFISKTEFLDYFRKNH